MSGPPVSGPVMSGPAVSLVSSVLSQDRGHRLSRHVRSCPITSCPVKSCQVMFCHTVTLHVCPSPTWSRALFLLTISTFLSSSLADAQLLLDVRLELGEVGPQARLLVGAHLPRSRQLGRTGLEKKLCCGFSIKLKNFEMADMWRGYDWPPWPRRPRA